MTSTLQSGFPQVAFGTSGVRALVADLTLEAVSAYVFAFVERMRQAGGLADGGAVAVAMDLRPSSPAIARAVCQTLRHLGHGVVFLGTLPTPALALHCLSAVMPGMVVTGSHIPFDRNGIKFYGPTGEILKEDEQAMATLPLPADRSYVPSTSAALPKAAAEASRRYVERYIGFFGAGALRGLRIGLYQHSAVGRDVTLAILEGLGATALPLARSDTFVPIDTEAVGAADLAQARQWCAESGLDAVVSTDGDGDRPLVFDADGNFIRGDLLGLICARALGIQALAVPVSCNTAIEQAGVFRRVARTRIGSPYVIAGMNDLLATGEGSVAGFEANGGFLLASSLPGLEALPTRDAILPMISILAATVQARRSLADLVADLPPRFTHSDRIQDVPNAVSRTLLARLTDDAAFRAEVFVFKGGIAGLDTTDGVRLTFADGDIVHLRASGNAPELRCYAEAGSYRQATQLCDSTLERVV
ncbi:phosphomannomutase [Ferrovibrio xuzhouensis]|uniref:Phosphomannomutase n=1 Tax=Ferrovibrio xuzhouensis TaxID=1576914 RepID=A0ABV7VL81_9PROT